MIVRVLVLLVAVLLVAASTERVYADLGGEAAALVDDAESVVVPEMPPARHVAARAPSRIEHTVAPAPTLASIFRPPRPVAVPIVSSRV